MSRKVLIIVSIMVFMLSSTAFSRELEYHIFRAVYPGQSIQAVIDSITDASATKRYAIFLSTGSYYEDITIKQYIGIFSLNAYGTVVLRGSNTTGTDVITMQDNSEIGEMVIQSNVNKDSGIEVTGSHIRIEAIGINGNVATLVKGISQQANVFDVKLKDVSVKNVSTGISITQGKIVTREVLCNECTSYGISITGGILWAYSTNAQGNTKGIRIGAGATVYGYDFGYYSITNSGTLYTDDVKTVDGVGPKNGNIDLVEGTGVTINPDPTAGTITISAAITPVSGAVDSLAVSVNCTPTGTPVIGDITIEGDGLIEVSTSGSCIRIDTIATATVLPTATPAPVATVNPGAWIDGGTYWYLNDVGDYGSGGFRLSDTGSVSTDGTIGIGTAASSASGLLIQNTYIGSPGYGLYCSPTKSIGMATLLYGAYYDPTISGTAQITQLTGAYYKVTNNSSAPMGTGTSAYFAAPGGTGTITNKRTAYFETGAIAEFDGTLQADGDVDLGNAVTDTITATGYFDSNLIPATDNSYDLGESGTPLRWRHLYLSGNISDGTDSVTVANTKAAYDHSQTTHDYAYISGNDGATNVTAAELEELTDGSVTSLHSHAGGGGGSLAIADGDCTPTSTPIEDAVLSHSGLITLSQSGSCITIGTGPTATVIPTCTPRPTDTPIPTPTPVYVGLADSNCTPTGTPITGTHYFKGSGLITVGSSGSCIEIGSANTSTPLPTSTPQDIKAFTVMDAPAGTDPESDDPSDTLVFDAVGAITITGDATTDKLTFAVPTVMPTSTPNVNNTLDQAYDQGGAGSGRSIDADSGPVEIIATTPTPFAIVDNAEPANVRFYISREGQAIFNADLSGIVTGSLDLNVTGPTEGDKNQDRKQHCANNQPDES